MKSLGLIWIAPTNVQVQTEKRKETTKEGSRVEVPKLHNSSSLAKVSLWLMLMLLVSAAALPAAFAQENSSADSTTPVVYSAENTGANYVAPSFPTFNQLPIVRPLPDPFQVVVGTRDTSFASWERRRDEIKAAIEKYEIGPKPDCADCVISAT